MMQLVPIIDPSTLTEKQKELIRDNYSIIKNYSVVSKEFSAGGVSMLEIIFGEEFFKSLKSK